MNGWICLHRKLLDCSLWQDNEPHNRRSAWIDLLLLANHHDKEIVFDGQKIIITRGQYMTSVRQLSERWGWSKDRTLRYLRLLEDLDMIHRDSDNKRTLITIINYEFYQGMRDTDKDTDKDTHKDTDKDTDTPQYNKDNNINNVNNNKKVFAPPTVEEVRAYCQERNNNINPESFVDFYQSKGWKVGSNPMKDWKACVRTWEKRDKEKPKPTNKFNNFEGRQYDTMELEKKLNGNWG